MSVKAEVTTVGEDLLQVIQAFLDANERQLKAHEAYQKAYKAHGEATNVRASVLKQVGARMKDGTTAIVKTRDKIVVATKNIGYDPHIVVHDKDVLIEEE